jgi:hypothetical protein
MNYVMNEIAENARLAASFYNGFANLMEGNNDDNEEGFKQFAEVFDIMARYEHDMRHFDITLLAYLADAYKDEDVAGFDARAAFGLGLELKRLVDRIGAAKLSEEQIANLPELAMGQLWNRAKEAATPAPEEAATP